MSTISDNPSLLRNIDVGEMIRLREQMATLQVENVKLRKVAEKSQALMDNIRRHKIPMAAAPWFQLKRALADLTTPDQPMP